MADKFSNEKMRLFSYWPKGFPKKFLICWNNFQWETILKNNWKCWIFRVRENKRGAKWIWCSKIRGARKLESRIKGANEEWGSHYPSLNISTSHLVTPRPVPCVTHFHGWPIGSHPSFTFYRRIIYLSHSIIEICPFIYFCEISQPSPPLD